MIAMAVLDGGTIIYCKGDMPDDKQFYDLDMGWKEYYLKTKKVIFKKGISSIGAGAFYNFQKLEEVVLPEGLRIIKYDAFDGCRKLQFINKPSTLEVIEKDVFWDVKIKSISLKNLKEKEIVKVETNIPKIAYTIKLPIKDIKITRRKLHLYLYILYYQ